MNKKQIREAIINMGNGDPNDPDSWIELRVNDLDSVLNELNDTNQEDEE